MLVKMLVIVYVHNDFIIQKNEHIKMIIKRKYQLTLNKQTKVLLN